MLAKLRLALGTFAVLGALTWVATPSAATAAMQAGGWCTTAGPGPGEEVCCSCVGNEEGGAEFCHQSAAGQGGTYWCSSSYCPYEDEPCGLAPE